MTHMIRPTAQYADLDDVANRIDADIEYAYSRDAFGEEWVPTIRMLLERGMMADEAHAVMCSKYTRWCRDEYSANDEGCAAYLGQYIDANPSKFTIRALDVLVEQTTDL